MPAPTPTQTCRVSNLTLWRAASVMLYPVKMGTMQIVQNTVKRRSHIFTRFYKIGQMKKGVSGNPTLAAEQDPNILPQFLGLYHNMIIAFFNE